MAKSKRGRALWNVPSRGRGTCPVCFTTRTKLLYTAVKEDGTSLSVCKRCNNASQTTIDSSVSNAVVARIPYRGAKRRKAFFEQKKQLTSAQ